MTCLLTQHNPSTASPRLPLAWGSNLADARSDRNPGERQEAGEASCLCPKSKILRRQIIAAQDDKHEDLLGTKLYKTVDIYVQIVYNLSSYSKY